MEIKIQSLESIHEAAREFIAAMATTLYLLYTERWVPAKRHLSKHSAKHWA